MSWGSLGSYYVARRIANDLDRQGKRLHPVIAVMVGIGALAVIGEGVCILAVVVLAAVRSAFGINI